MIHHARRSAGRLLTAICLAGAPEGAHADGRVEGRVTDRAGAPLARASVQLMGTAHAGLTEADGHYAIDRLDAGVCTLRVSHVGYQTATRPLEVRDGETLVVDIALASDLLLFDEVVVVGRLTGAQADALNAQKSSVNLRHVASHELYERFADFNAAETVRRLPGVAVDGDQGEGEFVHVRGLGAQLNSVTVNGRRIPSPTANLDEGRAVGLDLIQSHSAESVEVIKALTPDMAADALGGTINLELRRPPEEPLLSFAAAGGWNDKATRDPAWGGEIADLNGVAGRRYRDARLGVIAAGNLHRTSRGARRRELAYTQSDGRGVAFNRWDGYDVLRQRLGLLLGADYRVTARHEVRAQLSANRFVDDEVRRRREYLPGASSEEQETRNRREDQRFTLLDIDGTWHADRWRVDCGAGIAGSSETLPDRTYFLYSRANPYTDRLGIALGEDALADLGSEAAFPDLDPFVLSRNRYDHEKTAERDLSADVDVEYSFDFRGGRSTVKAGVAALRKDREASDRRWQYDVTGADVVAGEAEFGFVDVKYDDPAATALFPLGSYRPVAQSLNYDARETISATYLMTTLRWSETLTALVGVRGERTSHAYEHAVSAAASDEAYYDLLPSLHLTWRLDERTQLRLALTSGLARPEYSRLLPVAVPFEGQILRGNPQLRPTRGYGVDLALETFPPPLGLLSAGLFAKRILDPVVARVERQEVGGRIFEAIEPVNGDDGYVAGLELAVVQQLSILNLRRLRYLGLYANYTLAHSRIDYGSERVGDAPLTRSPRHAANLGLFYDNGVTGTALTLAATYRDPMLLRIERDPRDDVWFAEELHVDATVRQRLAPGWSLFVKLGNLTDESRRESFGEPGASEADGTRFRKRETYGRSGLLGLAWER